MPSGGNEFGKVCIFLSRSCGVFSSVIILLCGFIALIPLPFPKSMCIAMGLILIVSAVVMFFLEGTVIGHCVEQLKFLLVINKYSSIMNWVRAGLYMGTAVLLVVLVKWCLGASTFVGMFVLFLVGALNFILAIGTRGDGGNPESYSSVKWSKVEEGQDEEEEEETKEADQTL